MPGHRSVDRVRESRSAPEHERDVERRLVREEAVGLLSMVAECLAVVRGHDEERRAGLRFDLGHSGDFTEIRVRDVIRVERRRGAVGSMTVVEMNPEEAGAAGGAGIPALRGRHDVGGAPLGQHELVRLETLRISLVVDVEAPRQAEARVERKPSDERARRVPLRFQEGRERRERIGKTETFVVPHPVLVRIETREDVRVRRERDDVVGVRLCKDDPFRRQTVEVRRRYARVTRVMGRICAKRVDRHEDDVGAAKLREFRRRRRRTATPDQTGRQESDRRDRAREAGSRGARGLHFIALRISLAVSASFPEGSSSSDFWRSAFASGKRFNWYRASPR